ncbi:MAG: glycogen debranching enzyme N-terminal domain-containing protein [Bacteroidales bacterium]|nr:glycogen debranching enzyme N-terminal domain-containing protein [Bacteroidales bacterium]
MAFLKFNKSELVNLSYSLKREIIFANRTGAYCNTSIVTCNTRRYHGLFAVPVDAFGGQKHMLLSSVDESLVVNGKQFNLGIHCYGDVYEPRGHKYIVDFDVDTVPTITYKVGAIVFRKKIMLVPGSDQLMISYELVSAPAKASLKLKPFLAFRHVHDLTHQNDTAYTGFTGIPGGAAYCMYHGFPTLNLQLSAPAEYRHSPYWYNGVTYSDEMRRGFDCVEDLLVPGIFSLEMKPGDVVVLSASLKPVNQRSIKRKFNEYLKNVSPLESYMDVLLHNASQFKVERNGKKQICAGFSWLETGLLRETLLSLPGLTLYADGNTADFEAILDNLIADNQERLFHKTTQIEAPLLITDVLQQYIRFTGAEKKIWTKYADTLKGIIESYAPGVRKEVTLHPNGLLWAQMDGVALTWMNTYVDGRPVTERAGYQVDTNAWWYNALCFAIDMEAKYNRKKSEFVNKWSKVRDLVLENYQKTFWREDWGYLTDYVDNCGDHYEVRPNMLIPAYVEYSPIDDEVQNEIMHTVKSELLTTRGIRTLSPRNINYRGVYEGSQRDRDLTEYQGCAFPELLQRYYEIIFNMNGANSLNRAEYLREGFMADINRHGVSAFSELYDGDPPHEAHGAISSACTTAALLRCEYLINKYKEE